MQINKVIILKICFLLGAWAHLSAENIMKIHDINAFAGDVITVELEILNDAEFVGFNLDIPLPEGFTYINGTVELFRGTNHDFGFSQTSGNILKIIAFSITNDAFEGNDGVIFSFDLQAPYFTGDYPLEIVDAIIGTVELQNILNETIDGMIFLEEDMQPDSENVMKVSDATAATSGIVTIELEVINEDEFVGFNADISIPSGFTYVPGSAQLHRDDGHFFNFAIVEDNVARMISAAIPTTPFLCNDGVIASFDLQTPGDEGAFPFCVTNAVIADATGANIMTGQIPGTVILEDMQDNIYLYDLYFTDGMLECFSALISIITAGAGTEFIIFNGGCVELVAGQSIHLFPGTTVEHGGYFLARIAQHEDDYCGIPRAIEIAKEPVTSKEDDVVSAYFPYEIRENGFFKLYPNPTDGTFTLELTTAELEHNITVQVHSMLGGRLFTTELPAQRLHTLSLKGQQPGIYLIRVMQGEQVGVERLIKR